jgi:uncharacterized membrane protein
MADTETRPPAPEIDAFEAYPLTRSEYISAVVHFYRGERSRADSWRSRLDPTTNWAVVTVGGILSFAFSRVRMLEENFFLPIIRRDLVSPKSDWRTWVARDLDQPRFKLTFLQAVGIRLRYNYIWIFLVLGLSWLAKLNVHPTRAEGFGQVVERMAIGPIDGWVVGCGVLASYIAILIVAAGVGLGRGQDEVKGLETEMDHWRT